VEEVPYDLRCHDAAMVDAIAARIEAMGSVRRVEKGL
jgi:hypothetical protein